MRFDAGSTVITTAGTELRVNNIADRVMAIQFHNPETNTGRVFYGRADVSSSNGITLEVGEWGPGMSPGEGTVAFSVFWADVAVSGEKIEWQVWLETGEDT